MADGDRIAIEEAVGGHFILAWAQLDQLLHEQGDVVVLVK